VYIDVVEIVEPPDLYAAEEEGLALVLERVAFFDFEDSEDTPAYLSVNHHLSDTKELGVSADYVLAGSQSFMVTGTKSPHSYDGSERHWAGGEVELDQPTRSVTTPRKAGTGVIRGRQTLRSPDCSSGSTSWTTVPGQHNHRPDRSTLTTLLCMP
jgi:hypothetical protein